MNDQNYIYFHLRAPEKDYREISYMHFVFRDQIITFEHQVTPFYQEYERIPGRAFYHKLNKSNFHNYYL